jgi:alpha-tubulin suppressor-like RCC1 family protein
LGLGDYASRETPSLLNSISNVIDISTGYSHTLVLNNKGEVFSFGSNIVKLNINKYGQLCQDDLFQRNIPSKIKLEKKIKMVNAGSYSSFLLSEDGYIYACGQNSVNFFTNK